MKTRKKKTDRQKLMDRLDDLYRKIIKLRDGGVCQYTGKAGKDAHHIFSRSHHNTRWDLENGILLHGWHSNGDAHKNPERFRDFLIKDWFKGEEKYQMLKARAYTPSHFKMGDLRAIELYLKQKLGELNVR